MKLGASFSHPHLKSLNLDPIEAIKEFNKLNLRWIRLGSYWNEIEKVRGKYDFRNLDPLIEFCEKEKINVILTIGMKAPRWPEYYLPKWLDKQQKFKKLTKIKKDNKLLYEKATALVEKIVKRYKESPALKIWQVENEPLDPSGPKQLRIDYQFLKEEVNYLKKLDPTRKILITTWGNLLTIRKVYRKIQTISDIVGFNIYLRHPLPFLKYFHRYSGPIDPKDTFTKIFDELRKGGKKIWIAELQAEPWEPNEIITKKKNPPSFLPKHFDINLKCAASLKPEVTLLWGFEYWYWKKENGDLRYWQKAKRTINKFSK